MSDEYVRNPAGKLVYVKDERGGLRFPTQGEVCRDAEGTPDVLPDADGYLVPTAGMSVEELDLLHGNGRRASAPVRARSLKRSVEPNQASSVRSR